MPLNFVWKAKKRGGGGEGKKLYKFCANSALLHFSGFQTFFFFLIVRNQNGLDECVLNVQIHIKNF